MKKIALLAALATPVVATLVFGADRAVPDFEPVRVDHTGSLRVAMPPQRALPLFTGPGEVLWVDGWNPIVLSGDGIEEGTVFVTEHAGHTTLWVVVDYDPETLRARYSRTTPDVSAGTVDVRLRPDSQGGSEVQVTYSLTALSEAGNRRLAAFGDQEYVEMLAAWEEDIRAAEAAIAAHYGE